VPTDSIQAPTTVRFERDVATSLKARAVRRVQAVPSRRAPPMPEFAPHNLILPPSYSPLHVTRAISELCEDICRRVPAFRHIDMRRVMVTFVRCRNTLSWGFQAKLTPLRFERGATVERRRSHMYRIQRYFVGDLEMLYVLTFYMPRFLNQTFEEKLVTIFHELYHICPRFSGDIRRFDGAYCVHSHSQKEYDARMAVLAREYLAMRPSPRLYDFLKLNFAQLEARYGSVVGVTAPAPKLIPMV
jgi:predicted metallopeptidase